MSDQVHCGYCDRALVTVEFGRFSTHGAIAIRSGSLSGPVWIECPSCGRETVVARARLRLDPASRNSVVAPDPDV